MHKNFKKNAIHYLQFEKVVIECETLELMNMLSYQRRNAIAERVEKDGSADIASLVRDFNVSA